MKRIDLDEDETYLKAAAYGGPGTGKTNIGVTAPTPLFLLSERQAKPHIREAAKRLGKAMPPILFMERLADYRRVLRALVSGSADRTQPLRVVTDRGEAEYEGPYPETVVIDSLTDACMLVREEVYTEAPPEKAKDGLDRVTERHWSAQRDRSEKLIRAFRNLPLHVLFICGLDDKTMGEGEQQERHVGPAFPMRALAPFLCHSVNVVGITTREIKLTRGDEGQREIEYGLVTTGPGYMTLKPFRPLRDKEVPNFASWVQRIAEAGAIEKPSAEPTKKAGTK